MHCGLRCVLAEPWDLVLIVEERRARLQDPHPEGREGYFPLQPPRKRPRWRAPPVAPDPPDLSDWKGGPRPGETAEETAAIQEMAESWRSEMVAWMRANGILPPLPQPSPP